MSDSLTSRRQFVKLAGGLALAARHGLLSAAPSGGSGETIAAAIGDAQVRLEWDHAMHLRVLRPLGTGLRPVSAWRRSHYLQGSGADPLPPFELQRQWHESVQDAHGVGARLTLVAIARNGLEQTLRVTLYRDRPGFAIVGATYRNASERAVSLNGWVHGDCLVQGSGDPGGFWCYSGASYEDRRDWVRPVNAHFAQDNYLGMQASDYGGGTPIVDVWNRRGGLAVGHVARHPTLLALPVEAVGHDVRVAVSAHDPRSLEPGASFATVDTFIGVHEGDYYRTLVTYRNLMADVGIVPAAPPRTAYEPIWCAWGYERECTTALIVDTLPKVRDLGLKWAVIDDGWQAGIGDWRPHPQKYPRGEQDLVDVVTAIRRHDLRSRLWYSPLSVAPGSDLLHDHTDLLLLDKNGAVQNISWWNSFYLCPAYEGTVAHTTALVRKFLGDWGFDGLKIDGQHLNGVAPCFNPAHRHERPEESVEQLPNFYKAIYDTAMAINPAAVVEICPCGTAYSAFTFPYMNQAPASDPESSWQVRHKGKTLKGLMGPRAAFAGDHVELSDGHDDFASTVGIGAVVSTKFTWPVDPKPKDSFLLTPEREALWRHWIGLYNGLQLAEGTYRGELYDLAFDKPEAHVVEKGDRLYYAFYAPAWDGRVSLRGLKPGLHRVRDYVRDRDVGTVDAADPVLALQFEHCALLETRPVAAT